MQFFEEMAVIISAPALTATTPRNARKGIKIKRFVSRRRQDIYKKPLPLLARPGSLNGGAVKGNCIGKIQVLQAMRELIYKAGCRLYLSNGLS